MRNYIFIVAMAVFLIGVYIDREFLVKSSVLSASENNPADVVNPTVTPELSESEALRAGGQLTPTPTPRPMPTKVPTPSPISAPSINYYSTNSGAKANIGDYQYPGSQVVNSGTNNLTLNSNDDAAVITKWYEDKIKANGFNVTSFVKTNTNGKVVNVLAAANGSSQIRVEINKDQNSSMVTISVAIK